jgi:hypothetical protein
MRGLYTAASMDMPRLATLLCPLLFSPCTAMRRIHYTTLRIYY